MHVLVRVADVLRIIRLGDQLGSWVQLLCVGSPAERLVLCCRSHLDYSGHFMDVTTDTWVLFLALFFQFCCGVGSIDPVPSGC